MVWLLRVLALITMSNFHEIIQLVSISFRKFLKDFGFIAANHTSTGLICQGKRELGIHHIVFSSFKCFFLY